MQNQDHRPPLTSPSYALRAGRLFDGLTMSGPATVYVDAGRVTAVDRSGGTPPTGTAVIDLGPDTCLMPGLIDAHVHLAFDASADVIGAATGATDDELLDRMRSAARTALAAGVTTVRDLGDRGFLSLVLAGENLRDPARGPDVLAAGPPVTTPGGHCYFLGGEALGEKPLVAAVRERHERGCSVVKIMASGGNITPGSAPYRSQYSLDDLRTVVREAHRLGLPVAAHAHAVGAIRDAVAAGVDTLEHASFMTEHGVSELDPAVARSLADSGAFAVVTMAGWRDRSKLTERFKAAYASISSTVRAMHDMGVRIIAATDAGVGEHKPHGILPSAAHDILDFGIPPLDVLRSITSQAAAACGVQGRKGRVAAGADADFLAVGGDPLADVADLRRVEAVFRAGIRVR